MDLQPGPRGWHYRGYLPHFDGGSLNQFVTIRLADALPANVIIAWRSELEALPENQRDRELKIRVDEYTDRGFGECHLGRTDVAAIVENALLHFADTRYQLHAWVVMPNHVHALFQPKEGWSLSTIMHSWKSFTAHQANRLLRRTGQFWEPDYFDRFIRDEEHFNRVVEYIENNPVKAGLCVKPTDWLFGSARRRLRA